MITRAEAASLYPEYVHQIEAADQALKLGIAEQARLDQERADYHAQDVKNFAHNHPFLNLLGLGHFHSAIPQKMYEDRSRVRTQMGIDRSTRAKWMAQLKAIAPHIPGVFPLQQVEFELTTSPVYRPIYHARLNGSFLKKYEIKAQYGSGGLVYVTADNLQHFVQVPEDDEQVPTITISTKRPLVVKVPTPLEILIYHWRPEGVISKTELPLFTPDLPGLTAIVPEES